MTTKAEGRRQKAEGFTPLKAPFPWFGGKSRVAHIVWERFGDVKNYVEPFAGSLAVLLGRPHSPRIETVNDKDCYLANFWRALGADPEGVVAEAKHPVNEADQHARHLWLVNQPDFVERMKTDPNYYDVRVAGWWVWGVSIWIGSGWCASKRPHLGDAGRGVHRQLPHLGNAGRGASLAAYFCELADRLHRVRVCCGDWRRVCTPAVTFRHGLTGVLLDPPYADTAKRTKDLYAVDDLSVAHDVRDWAVENGGNPLLRIAVCGYEGEHKFPRGWKCVPWKAAGGFSSQSSRGSENCRRERIWFSPHCLKPKGTK